MHLWLRLNPINQIIFQFHFEFLIISKVNSKLFFCLLDSTFLYFQFSVHKWTKSAHSKNFKMDQRIRKSSCTFAKTVIAFLSISFFNFSRSIENSAPVAENDSEIFIVISFISFLKIFENFHFFYFYVLRVLRFTEFSLSGSSVSFS